MRVDLANKFDSFFRSCLEPHIGSRMPMSILKCEWIHWCRGKGAYTLPRASYEQLEEELKRNEVLVTENVVYDMTIFAPQTLRGQRFLARQKYTEQYITPIKQAKAQRAAMLRELENRVRQFFAELYEVGVPFQELCEVVRADWFTFAGSRAAHVSPQLFNKIAHSLGVFHNKKWYFFLLRKDRSK